MLEFTEEKLFLLKRSPIYNFSLSSKELFHSNFLYWLLNDIVINENKSGDIACISFWDLLYTHLNLPQEYSGYKIENQENTIHREKNNLDLTFSIVNLENNKINVIIENKVKSIPYKEQLEKYSNTAPQNHLFILLTLHDPISLKVDGKIILANKKIWHVITYKNLSDILKEYIESSTKNTINYRNYIINDYLQLIDFLVEVDNTAERNFEGNFNWYSGGFYKSLIELRIADFYIKKMYKLLEDDIKNEISKNESLKGLISENDSSSNKIMFYCGFTNKTGLIDIRFKYLKNMFVGIQIQGNQFRLFIENQKVIELDKLKKIIEGKEWLFDFSIIENNVVPDEFKIYPKDKGFNNYSNKFYYKYVKIPENTAKKQLIECILEYLEIYKEKLEF